MYLTADKEDKMYFEEFNIGMSADIEPGVMSFLE